LAVAVASACHGGSPATPTVATGGDVPSGCPIVRVEPEWTPSVQAFASLDDAATKLARSRFAAGPHAREEILDDLEQQAKRTNAFVLEVRDGALHESDCSVTATAAVFVRPANVVVVTGIAKTFHCLPASTHGLSAIGDDYRPRDAEIAAGHIGHVRVLRSGVHTASSLPPATASPAASRACTTTTRKRIEDLFVDLDSPDFLSVEAQTYDAPECGASTPSAQAIPFNGFVVDANEGVTVHDPRCAAFASYWDN
jgi:hypothetical protein